ncbi:hypothetical protein SALBM217S_08574 [Streptomyces griseoloalbus]
MSQPRPTGLVGDPALCWNSTDRRRNEPGAYRGRDNAPSGGEKGNPPVTHDHHGDVFRASPTTPTPSLPFRGRTPGPEVATLVQGRFKRDGSASAEPEPTRRGSPDGLSPSPQHAQNQGPPVRRRRRTAPGAPARPLRGPGGPHPGRTPPHGPTGPGPRIALRNWRISTRLVVAGLRPPGGRGHLAGRAAHQQSMDDIQQLDNMKLLTDMTKQATELAAALQEERDQSPARWRTAARPPTSRSRATARRPTAP